MIYLYLAWKAIQNEGDIDHIFEGSITKYMMVDFEEVKNSNNIKEETTNTQEKNVCPNCHVTQKPGAVFCANCGAKIK